MSGPRENLASLLRARRGYLGTVGPDGTPNVVPVCFTWAGDAIWTSVDGKPKSTDRLQRVRNIEADARVSFTVDRWDEDWSKLAWLQAKGNAVILGKSIEADKATEALESKYSQYLEVPLNGPVIRIDVDEWIGWSAD
ncbi:MAG: TIGR03668 family PPOX class F420-dependent oxidoreductase [Actinomycetota bacterium]